MDFALKRYFRSMPRVSIIIMNLTSNYQLLIPADPDRFMIALSGNATAVIAFSWGEGPPLTSQVQMPTSGGPWFLTEDDAGGLIQMPVWVKSASTGFQCEMVTCSYDPARKREMDERVRRILSNPSAL